MTESWQIFRPQQWQNFLSSDFELNLLKKSAIRETMSKRNVYNE